jgi:hypothetical protein
MDMDRLKTRSVLGLIGLLAMLALAWPAEAQMAAATAEVVRLVGRVDVLPKGQTAWTATAVGARLREGDQIRALAGGSADLNLPDGSTLLVAENTRFAVTKLDYDTANRDRDVAIHVVAGKVRAQVQQAGVTLARTRQSNFNISTPTGVAAVRGTILIIAFNPATQETLTFVFPSPGQAPASARATFYTRGGQPVTVTAGNFVRQVGNQPAGSPTPIGNLPPAVQGALTTTQNASTANSSELVTINVTLPSSQDTTNLINQGGTGAGAGDQNVTSTGGPVIKPSSIGQDIKNSCASLPCPTLPAGSSP